MEEIKSILFKENPNIEILDNIYINNSTKMKCRCITDGYEWDATWANLSRRFKCPKCSGLAKPTMDYIKNEVMKLSPNIIILDSEYINNNHKMNCRCKIDNHEWGASWKTLSRGQGCPLCGGSMQLTIELVKSRLSEINPNIKINDSTYLNANVKLNCICLIDGCNHEWKVAWVNLYSGCGCPKCANKCIDIDFIKTKLKNISPLIKINSTEYKNNNTKLECLCLVSDCNHEWGASWSNLQNGHGCYKCARKRIEGATRLTIEDVRLRLSTINKNILLLAEEYKNASTKLKCQCLIEDCGHIWTPPWQSLSQGIGCPKCANRSHDGSYNYVLAERNVDKWKATTAVVYVIECFNDDEKFYKIGITNQTVRVRFAGKHWMPYKYNIVCELPTNMYDAVFIEKDLHDNNKQYSYIPQIKFGGWTECFSELVNHIW